MLCDRSAEAGIPCRGFFEDYMSYSQYFLPNLMDMGSLLGTILRAILNYKRVSMSTLNGPLVKQILTVAHTRTLGFRV